MCGHRPAAADGRSRHHRAALCPCALGNSQKLKIEPWSRDGAHGDSAFHGNPVPAPGSSVRGAANGRVGAGGAWAVGGTEPAAWTIEKVIRSTIARSARIYLARMAPICDNPSIRRISRSQNQRRAMAGAVLLAIDRLTSVGGRSGSATGRCGRHTGLQHGPVMKDCPPVGRQSRKRVKWVADLGS
jgi:hypothetical protein